MPDGFPEICGSLDEPCRWTMWNVEGQELYLYSLMLLAVLLLVGRLWMRLNVWLKGQDELPFDHLPVRIGRVLKYALGQYRILRDRTGGIIHGGIFFGFTALFIGTALATIDQDITAHFFDQKILVGWFYRFYEATLDAFTLFFIVGLAYAGYRRRVLRPEKLTYSSGWNFVLFQLWLLVLTGLILEALRLAALDDFIGDTWGRWSFAGWSLAQGLLVFNDNPGTWRLWHEGMWWFHSIQVAVFIVSLADSPLKHIIYSPLNIFFSPIRPRGKLKPLDLEDESIEQFGVGHLTDFTVLQLMDGDACTECGRCQAACPAYMAGTPLNPKKVAMDIRRAMNHYSDNLGVGLHPAQKESFEIDGAAMPVINLAHDGITLLTPEAMWACTTCFACVQECPVLIQHVESIVDVRRHLVLMEGAPPDLLGTAFTNAERSGNPWNDRSSRLDWTKPLEFDVPVMAEKKKVDVLYWIGCAGSFDPNSQKTSRAVAKILNAAGVEWAILGDEEQCHCEWARRGGNEFLYQESSLPIIETLNGYEFDVIITHCPHCFNTMKNEFPDFGGNYTVVHHSQYIAKLIAEGKIKPDYSNGRSDEMGAAIRHITYHDSCYLGRYNDVYESPRDLLKTIPGVQMVEMARSKDRGLCCGGGGAQVWMETHQHDPVNQIRLTEAVNALNGDVPYDVADAVRKVPETPVKVDKPGTVATACPFCTIMLDSAQQSMQIEDIQIRDVAEIVAEGIK
ncbi:MAG: 4Fe-4S dicluster domain-containing protein [Chloroflexi bacterium]|nr:4Fe-4S dicluster domain-containing protein [Chloroflexota bacterium]